MEALRQSLDWLISLGILFFETAVVVVLLLAGLRAILCGLRKGPHTSILFARGIAMALQFKLASEILHTVQIREMQDLYLIGGIVLISIALTALTHFEIRENEHRHEREAALQKEQGASPAEFPLDSDAAA